MSFAELMHAALVGTARQAPHAALPALAGLPAEARLLRGAAYEGLRLLAGRLPERGAPADLPTSPAESLPEVAGPAAARLREILSQQPELLPEWCELAHERGLRVSHVLLPDLLEHTRTHPEVVDVVKQVGGERLTWLAGLNPAWRFAAAANPLALFDTGESRDERSRGLRAIRQRDPAQARDLLAASWDGESAEARVTLLGALEDGLSVQDEPLIMRAVSDARKEVRQVALRLIRRMPGSSFAERWRERARAHVTLKKAPLGRRLRVEVREPAFEPSWAADGAEQRAPKGTGQVAWWLQQLVALAPPDTWPDDALPAVLSSDWAGPLVAGLAESAEAYRHPAWSGRLIIAWAAARAKRSQWPRLEAAGLLAGMPPSAAESVLRQALQEDPTAGPALVPGLRHAWSEDFSRFFARRLADLADQWSYAATGPLSEAALRLDPSVLPDAQRSLDNPNPHAWTAAALERLVRCLDYRQQMRRELAA